MPKKLTSLVRCYGTKPSQIIVCVARYSATPAQMTKTITPTMPSFSQLGH